MLCQHVLNGHPMFHHGNACINVGACANKTKNYTPGRM